MSVVCLQFVDGHFEGLGVETFADGTYAGCFRDGQRHGSGKAVSAITKACFHAFECLHHLSIMA